MRNADAGENVPSARTKRWKTVEQGVHFSHLKWVSVHLIVGYGV
jgi:hypothetical protein